MDESFMSTKPFQILRPSVSTVIMESNRQCGPHHLRNNMYTAQLFALLESFTFSCKHGFPIRELGEAQKH